MGDLLCVLSLLFKFPNYFPSFFFFSSGPSLGSLGSLGSYTFAHSCDRGILHRLHKNKNNFKPSKALPNQSRMALFFLYYFVEVLKFIELIQFFDIFNIIIIIIMHPNKKFDLNIIFSTVFSTVFSTIMVFSFVCMFTLFVISSLIRDLNFLLKGTNPMFFFSIHFCFYLIHKITTESIKIFFHPGIYYIPIFLLLFDNMKLLFFCFVHTITVVFKLY